MTGSLAPKLGLYVSIPFCRSKCTYCNFASGVYPASDHPRYVNRLIEDMEAAPEWAKNMGLDMPRAVDSIYLGGGTPNLLAPDLVERLFAAIRQRFFVEPDAEITVECAPGQFAAGTMDALAQAGVNRVSLGVQSFIDSEAQASGRLHTRAVVLEDIFRLRRVGISNLNVDLIAGLAGQTMKSWRQSLDALIDIGTPHASVYMLEVDEDSRLGREMLAGGARYHAGLVPSDETIAHMYEKAIERLNAEGLQQYEISNFARPGRASRHNLRYWGREPYLGLGLDAASMLCEPKGGDGYVLRSNTTADLRAYLDKSEPAETAWLSPDRQFEEAWFLGLRRNAGVNLEELRSEFGEERAARSLIALERLKKSGMVDFENWTVQLTAKGRLLSNDVFQEFLESPAEGGGE